MDFTALTVPPDNTSFFPSSDLSLCPSAATRLLLPSVYTLLFLTALPGNALSLWVFLRCISTISPTHVYLSHLSISNLLLSVSTPFLAAYYARGTVWALSGAMCQLVLHGITPALHINVYISVMILTWLALSRFAAIIRHTHASRPSTFTTLLPHTFFTCLTRASFASRVCATVWAVAVGGVVPVTVYYSVNEAMRAGGAGAAGAEGGGGCVEVCYNPTVEIGGSLSATFTVPVIVIFFVFYLLVLVSYLTVLKHIRRSRRSARLGSSHSLLGRVLRNIVIIQVVLSLCLLPYHIFKPVFISVAHYQHHLTRAASTDDCSHCHPLSTLVELKNCLFLLATLRGSTDPAMYLLLDRTFRQHSRMLLQRHWNKAEGRPTAASKTERMSAAAAAGQLDENMTVATADCSYESVL